MELLRWRIVQDWARLHGYEMHVMAAATDVRIRPGPWQKIAMVRQVRVSCGGWFPRARQSTQRGCWADFLPLMALQL